eukprot:gene29050-32252_t
MARTKITAVHKIGHGATAEVATAVRVKPTKVSAPPASRASPKQSAKQLKAQKTHQAKASSKAGGTSGTRSVPASGSGATFVVSSSYGNSPNGFYRYEEPEEEIDSVHSTRVDAQDRALALFFNKNPWGLPKDEVRDMDYTHVSDGHLGEVHQVERNVPLFLCHFKGMPLTQ